MNTAKIRYSVLVLALILLGAGCAPAAPESRTETVPPAAGGQAPVTPPSASTDTPPVSSGEVCPETPQVYYFNKLAFSSAELVSIEANVVEPLSRYYREMDETHLVSVVIRRTETGISVEAVVDQPYTDEPVFHSFIHPRTGSAYPRWYPEEVPPEYRG